MCQVLSALFCADSTPSCAWFLVSGLISHFLASSLRFVAIRFLIGRYLRLFVKDPALVDQAYAGWVKCSKLKGLPTTPKRARRRELLSVAEQRQVGSSAAAGAADTAGKKLGVPGIFGVSPVPTGEASDSSSFSSGGARAEKLRNKTQNPAKRAKLAAETTPTVGQNKKAKPTQKRKSMKKASPSTSSPSRSEVARSHMEQSKLRLQKRIDELKSRCS